VAGSASWEEFRRGLRENHSENEMAYTPSVTSVERLLEWPTEGEIEGGWRQVGMHGELRSWSCELICFGCNRVRLVRRECRSLYLHPVCGRAYLLLR
jgi:hypothetical protein